MSKDRCPFCGAEKYDNSEMAAGKYRCGTLDNDQLPRLDGCWRQWALNLQAENTALYESLEDKRRLTREIDVIISGDQAAEQASLCDLIPLIQQIMKKLEAWRGLKWVAQALDYGRCKLIIEGPDMEAVEKLRGLGEVE